MKYFLQEQPRKLPPVNSIDKKMVGRGGRGPVTKIIQQKYLDIVTGRIGDVYNWLTYI